MIGAVRDPRFGMLIVLGLGGIFAELLADTSTRLCPIDANDANSVFQNSVEKKSGKVIMVIDEKL